MERRPLLSAVLGLILSGCSFGENPNSNGENADSPTKPTTPTPAETSTLSPPSFELIEISAPNQVEVNEEVVLSITIKNTGEADGKFQSEVYFDKEFDRRDIRTDVLNIETTIPAGQTKTIRTDPISFEFITKITYWIEAFEASWTIETTLKQLDFGEIYLSPHGIKATVLGVEFKNEYEGRGRSTETPSDGKQWAFVDFKAKNTGVGIDTLPYDSNIGIIAGEQEYRTVLIYKGRDGYTGGEVLDGEVREGKIVYEIDESHELNELRVCWDEVSKIGIYGACWSGNKENA